jgi:hypothetical protein
MCSHLNLETGHNALILVAAPSHRLESQIQAKFTSIFRGSLAIFYLRMSSVPLSSSRLPWPTILKIIYCPISGGALGKITQLCFGWG